MYVLMDVEWYCGSGGRIFPTQLAALRTDESWNRRDRFFSRIRPDRTDTPNWTHIAFSGGEPEDFLCAPTLSAALRDLRMWLQMDDVLCWWAEEAPKVFKRLHTPLLQAPPAVPHRVLLDHVSPILISKGIAQENPYKIATFLGLEIPTPAHCSEHDVLTIQTVLRALDFPQENLRKQAKRRTSRYGSRQDPVRADMPYQLDTDTGLLHRKDCDDIPDGLETALLYKNKSKRCCRCGALFCPGSNRGKYLPDCAVAVHCRQKAECERRRRVERGQLGA